MMQTNKFAEQQQQDACLALLVHWLRAKQAPPQGRVGATTAETKYHCSHFNKLRYIDNIAYIKTINEDDTRRLLRVLVPQQLNEIILTSACNAPISGHF